MSSFDLSALHSMILESTPLCDDVIGIIANLARPDPSRFKVGESYVISTGTTIQITRLTKCFVRFDVLRGDRCIDIHQMAKIRLDPMDHQYITHKYINDRVVAVQP